MTRPCHHRRPVLRPARPRRRRAPACARRPRAARMASCSSNTARARASRSTTAASARRPTTRRAASACAPWRRGGGLCPCGRVVRRRAGARRRDGEGGAPGPFGRDGRRRRARPTRGSMRMRTRWRRWTSPPRPRCCRRSTPTPAPRDPRVVQVMASIFGEWQAVQIIRPDGQRVADLRPLVRLQRLGGGGAGRPARDRQPSAPAGASTTRRILAEAVLEGRRGRGAAPGAGQPRQRARAGRARWRWCSARAGPASCCTRRSATGWKATSTARRPPPSPGCSASASPRPGVTVVDDGTIPDRRGIADRGRRGHADQPHRADRGRHPGRLPAGPAERAADGRGADRQRPPAEPTRTSRCRA